MDITPYLKLMVEKDASDLFITTNSPIKVKIEGKATPVGKTILTADLTKAAAYGIMNDHQKKSFEETMECDFAIPLEDKARFRVNVFRQRGAVGMVLRRIPNEIPTTDQLGVPDILNELILNKRGLILMVGGTGSGKSTTLAAMINHRNTNMTGHILTIEDPVEFSHPNIKSLLNQREVGVDTQSYANALKASLREAPDVILIGEIRDRITMEAALELSNTGHLAISTLHANNANQAMERVINMFPQDYHKQLFMDLSLNVRAIVSQRLVLGIDGKRCAAIEILINTPHIAELILKGEIDELKEAMDTSGQRGMQTFDQALLNLYKEERIELEEALRNADSRSNLENKISFG
ncbi:MAG: twitching motility protein PilU [Gammaproteobacteria bacterium]|jgi:twitching motility protein PilU